MDTLKSENVRRLLNAVESAVEPYLDHPIHEVVKEDYGPDPIDHRFYARKSQTRTHPTSVKKGR
ncbi:hypothetical protein EVB97_054 [Rhizobium phage RHph_Y65]|nr:hypothetical protein PQC17_gp054 [Rhizobium phage RHph_Y65]QIG72612.1 hypothetical protein EVB97_054 [Rhizobium phage RHph_Y65]